MPVIVEGRRVFVVTGRSTQTVNICTDANRRGTYESVFRLTVGNMVTEDAVAQRTALADLRQWLGSLGATTDGPRSGTTPIGSPAKKPRIVDVEVDDAWFDNAVRVVDVAIDSLVLEFLDFPYLHRVEHSLHARLFGILAAHPIFAHVLPIGRTGHFTQPVHKEWPETKSREDKDGRRGNFDLAILSANQLESVTLDDFRQGRIASAIVIEMGLDYDFGHLSQDHEKLLNSDVRAGYLVDFVRNRPPDERTENLILNAGKGFKTAYVHHSPSGERTFKTVSATKLQRRG